MITRTVVGTQLTAKVANSDTDEIYTKSLVVDAKLDGEDAPKKALRMASKLVEANEVVMSVSNLTPVEKLYGVPVDAFMAVAIELDPVTRKPLATDFEPDNE